MRRAWPFSNICLSPLWRKLVIMVQMYGDTRHRTNGGNGRLWWRRGELNQSGVLKTRKLLISVFHQFRRHHGFHPRLHNFAQSQCIEQAYQTAFAECRFDGATLPPASAVQELIAAWKVLRRYSA